jgi:hypothetical protein
LQHGAAHRTGMSITKQQAKQFLQRDAFGELFIALGWDAPQSQPLPIKLDERILTATVVAEKRGFAVLVVHTKEPLTKPERHKVERKVARSYFEHLVIFHAESGQQLWQLAIRRPNQPITFHETPWHKGQEPELLYQKLSGLFIPLAEEEKITLVDVRERVTREFEKQTKDVTKKFYAGFKQEHDRFLKFIEGLNDQDAKKWYASLMLNRLMFIYFMQRKGFMDGKKDYLSQKLHETEKAEGKDKFYGFYRNFLRVLFHQGLGDPKRTPELEKRIGKVPYLNGGLFDEHDLKKDNPKIQIKDEAFKKLFAFFDEWQWTLDTRQQASGKEVNPDVIGYIFEQYINDRAQMGAYYTKEDITEYIAKNTIIPWLFDAAKAKDAQAFKPEGGVWELLRNDADRYIHASVKHGVDPALMDEDDGKVPWHKSPVFNDLRKELRAGLNPDQKDLVAKRKCWNRTADGEKALPTEIWREVIERRRRYLEVRRKLVAGEVTAINDLITYNLDIRQFAQDVLHEHESGDLVWAFYDAIQHVTVLDPTCGSGAFLFAALGILQPLYEECLQRMAEFREQAKAEGKPKRWQQFQPILDRIAKHHDDNRAYFIYKSIILQNLYGVDIMPEAVEIAKLRLFLKLVSTVEPDPKKPSYGIEPLPDIDFNIRAGNTLVGFGTKAELDKGLTYTLDGLEMKASIEEKCDVVAKAFERYKRIQLNEGEDYATFHGAKNTLLERLKTLRDELDRYLGKQYGKDAEHKGGREFDAWKKSHKPFHWFAEYYGIVEGRGGFDVIIGNPPYIEYSKVKSEYSLNAYTTLPCGNVYGYVMERAGTLMNAEGEFGIIVPLSICSSERMSTLRTWMTKHMSFHISNFEIFPSKLFEGAFQRVSIVLGSKDKKRGQHITKLHRWYSVERENLMDQIAYSSPVLSWGGGGFFKTRSNTDARVLAKLQKDSKTIGHVEVRQSEKNFVFYQEAVNYWTKATTRVPYYKKNGKKETPAHSRTFHLTTDAYAAVSMALVNSSLFYAWYISLSDGFHLNDSILKGFPVRDKAMADKNLVALAGKLEKEIKATSFVTTRNTKKDAIELEAFKMSLCKPILDEIDALLAGHYGLSAEELDFVINYDIKYRMGDELEGEE